MKRYSIIASGRVQGVGFRAYVQEIAYEMDIHGWVRNLPDGTVEIEAEGDDEKVMKFITAIRNSNDNYIQVQAINTRSIPCTGDQDFIIRRFQNL